MTPISGINTRINTYHLYNYGNRFVLLGRHKSIDKAVRRSIRRLERIPEVTRIILGISAACRHKYSPGDVRWKRDAEGGIKVNGYSGKGVTDIFIKIEPISARETVKAKIKSWWPC